MSLMDKLLGHEERRRSMNEYEELDLEQYEGEIENGASTYVHIADVRGQEGVMDVKDTVYDGDMVLADISYLRTSDTNVDRVVEELRQVTDEVGGDIVQKGDDQLIITPGGIKISRDKISR